MRETKITCDYCGKVLSEEDAVTTLDRGERFDFCNAEHYLIWKKLYSEVKP